MNAALPRVAVAFNDASSLLWLYFLNLQIVALVVVPELRVHQISDPMYRTLFGGTADISDRQL